MPPSRMKVRAFEALSPFEQRVQLLAERAGKTPAALASPPLSTDTVNNWCRKAAKGRPPGHTDELHRFAGIVGAPVAWLLDPTPLEPGAKVPSADASAGVNRKTTTESPNVLVAREPASGSLQEVRAQLYEAHPTAKQLVDQVVGGSVYVGQYSVPEARAFRELDAQVRALLAKGAGEEPASSPKELPHAKADLPGISIGASSRERHERKTDELRKRGRSRRPNHARK